jgi:hypothetical protein
MRMTISNFKRSDATDKTRSAHRNERIHHENHLQVTTASFAFHHGAGIELWSADFYTGENCSQKKTIGLDCKVKHTV